MFTGKTVVGASQRGTTVAVAALLSSLTAAAPASGQDVTVDVAECVELEAAEARLTCFAARVDAVLEEQPAEGSAEPSAVNEPVDADRGPRENGDVSIRREEPAERRAEQPAVEDRRGAEAEAGEGEGEYFGTIVAVRERLPSAYVITLDNGQIWQQTEPKRYPLRPGLEVRIYPTNWGDAYRLNGRGTGGHIQVQRVR